MKRIILLLATVALAWSAVAQSADSLAFVSARHRKLKLKGAEGYTLSVSLFDAAQTISVIKFSPEKFRIVPCQPENVMRTSEQGEMERAEFAINACFWAVTISKPTCFLKRDGAVLSTSHPSGLPRVNGLLKMYDDHLEVVPSRKMPEYDGLVDDCNNIIACGPVLIDDGAKVSYQTLIESTEPSLQRKIPFFIRRHPRSAVGCNAQGEIFLVVVDGRAEGRAEGVTIAELTNICAWLGMTEALNLDGGGSSTLWSRKYGVLNHPCDNKLFDNEGERRVSSTLVVKKKK